MSRTCLFISPQENATKIGRCWIHCVLQWFWFKNSVYFHKAYVCRQIKAMSLCFDHTEDAFRTVAPPFRSEMMPCRLKFQGEIRQTMFSPLGFCVFVGSSLIHRDFVVSRTFGRCEHATCLLWEHCFLQMGPSRHPPAPPWCVLGGRWWYSLSSQFSLLHSQSHLSQPEWRDELSSHKPSGREQKLVRLNMQQAVCRRCEYQNISCSKFLLHYEISVCACHWAHQFTHLTYNTKVSYGDVSKST